METDSSCKKWVKKCREMVETVARSVERTESIRRQMEKKEKSALDGWLLLFLICLFICLFVYLFIHLFVCPWPSVIGHNITPYALIR